jgi:hypothetical protein
VSERLETPSERWSRDARQLVPLTPDELERAFVVSLGRTPSKDGLVSIDGVDYELPSKLKPRGRKKERVQILRRLLTETYHVLVEGRLVQLHPVDLVANARAPRGGRGPDEGSNGAEQPPARSAADMAFEGEFGPVTDADGGFSDPAPEEIDP